MTICYFGSYNPNYSRNKILIDGLRKNGVTVLECRSTERSFIRRYPILFKKFWSQRNRVNVIVVGFVGHLDMPLAWLLARLTGKKVIFDMFYSMYDTYVFDRKSTTPKSLIAKSYFWIDKIAAILADCVITDTKAHGDYFIKIFGLNSKKFRRVFVGGDETVFKPIKRRQRKKVVVEFHGMFTRLHGAEYFVEAAKLLDRERNLEFWLIGNTNNYPLPIERFNELRPKTMKYFSNMPVDKLAKKIAQADISVAHIGTTEKAKNVITNKMFQAIFCKVALIAGDCKATRELLTDRDNTLFVRMGDTQDLAKKIMMLTKNPKLRKELAENGHELAKINLTNKELGKRFLKIIREDIFVS